MFEERARTRVRGSLEKQFQDFLQFDKGLSWESLGCDFASVLRNRSTNECNMTRKTRSRQLRVQTAFESGFCELCHIPCNSLEEHVQSKRHLKLIGDDGSFISIKGFGSYLALDGIDAFDVTRRNKMRRTRACSDRMKDSPLSPVGSDSGHRLRSRKNINYMTPPLDEDSLTEKPEVVKEYRELRSSTRLLAKLTDQMVENDEVWNSGRPKRSCNRQRISADERLVVDNKSYYKVEVLSSKLRSGVTPFQHQEVVKRPDTPKVDDKGLIVKFRKLRNSELVRLNNEAENFLFPKKDDDSSDDEDEATNSIISDNDDKKIKTEDEESMHSTSSESKMKKRRRTHAEAFIMDNQKYYKFETPGSRLRYQGSYLSPVPMKLKNNGECMSKNEQNEETDDRFKLNLEKYNFSFESVPKGESWYQTFQRMDRGKEKYIFLDDKNFWDPFILPYQLDYISPLNPKECIAQYNQIKKCLTEPPSASTSVTCSTPDASNSSVDAPFVHDEDSKISIATEVSSTSTLDELRPRNSVKKPRKTSGGKNPRKSPRQHASTLAILSNLIQQRKRKLRLPCNLPTISEEPHSSKPNKKPKVDYFSLIRNIEEEFAKAREEYLPEVEIEKDENISFKGPLTIEDLLNTRHLSKNLSKSGKPGRKPGKRKKNRTGWPLNRNRRNRRAKDDDSTVDSTSVNSEEEAIMTDSTKEKESVEISSENNNKNDQSSDVNIDNHCDLNNEDRVDKNDNKSDETVLMNKVNSESFNFQYQPIVRVQKLDKSDLEGKKCSSPKKTNRGQRRMPASPKSPRALRRPRGRWYRER